MNLNKKYITIIATVFFVLSGTFYGCNEDFLEVTPKDGIFEPTVWASYENANLFLSDIYRSLPWDILFGKDPLDNWTDHGMATFDNSGAPSRNILARRDYSSDSSPVNVKWGDNYGLIRKCNIVLQNAKTIESATEEQKNFLIAQAKFFRAFYYSDLINYFGGVPIIDKVLDRATDGDLEYSRSSYDECVSFIQNDLNQAIPVLHVSYSGADKNRITKGAALALKSEVELYAKKWADCVQTCEAIFNLGVYNLVADFPTIFNIATENNKEVIFSVDFDGQARAHAADVYLSPRIDPTSGNVSGWGHYLPTQDLVDAFEFKDGKTWDDPVHINNPYEGRENRFYWSILYDGANWRTSKDQIWTRWDSNLKQGSISNSFDENNSHQGTLTGYYFRKYLDASVIPDIAHIRSKPINSTNAVFWRYAEILLNYAEAKNELSGPDAAVYAAINQLRTRGGLSELSGLSQGELRKRIRQERRIELAFEGKRYWDIMRWKIGDQVLNKNMTAMRIEKKPDGSLQYKRVPAFGGFKAFNSPRDYLFPIPQTAVDRNSKLTQNPGW